jgi:hypothetical protein
MNRELIKKLEALIHKWEELSGPLSYNSRWEKGQIYAFDICTEDVWDLINTLENPE